jgi:hypothetical protein
MYTMRRGTLTECEALHFSRLKFLISAIASPFTTNEHLALDRLVFACCWRNAHRAWLSRRTTSLRRRAWACRRNGQDIAINGRAACPDFLGRQRRKGGGLARRGSSACAVKFLTFGPVRGVIRSLLRVYPQVVSQRGD